MTELINMALVSFITGFGIVTIYEKKHKVYRIQNRILGGVISGVICTLIHIILQSK